MTSSIPGLSGEVDDGLGRLTVIVGKGIEGSGPVVKVISEPLRVSELAEHCVWDRMWYVVDARIPATRIVVRWYLPGTGYQLVFLPYEVSGPNSIMLWPAHPLEIETCATKGFVVAETCVFVSVVLIPAPQADIKAMAAKMERTHNAFE